MVHDALRSENWRDRWEALTYTSKHFGEVAAPAVDRVAAVCEVLSIASKDKMPKVFLVAVAAPLLLHHRLRLRLMLCARAFFTIACRWTR